MSSARTSFLLPFVFCLIAQGLFPVASAAADDESGAGHVLIRDTLGNDIHAVHLRSDVRVSISGFVALVELTQSFRNQTTDFQEATYVLPMPENAAVNFMEMQIGDRRIVAKVREKQQARKIYEQAKQAGKKAALTEQSRPNLFRQTVANIAPGETIHIQLRYVQTVKYDQGQFTWRLPMTLTPRFMPGVPVDGDEASLIPGKGGWAAATTEVPDAPLISPPMVDGMPEGFANDVSIRVLLDPGLPLKEIGSLFHDVSVSRDQGRYVIELVDEAVPMDRDYVLNWTPATGSEPGAAVFRETVEGEDYLLIMMLPPAQQHTVRALPRDMIFVIDTSGSMQGTSINQARRGLQKALADLRPEDRFNVIEFNSRWRRLFSEPQVSDEFNVQKAMDWVAQLSAGGGTNMLPALDQALQEQTDEGYLKHIVFITDGAVGNEKNLFEAIHNGLGGARLFPVGIGSAPNSFFMREAAKFGRGTYTHIGDISEVESKMDSLFTKIESPVVTGINLNWPIAVSTYPERLPALYNGEPLLILARTATASGELEIEGVTVAGRWHRKLDLATPAEREGIATLWARKRIQELEDEKVRGGDPELLRQGIIETGLRHQLISNHTSLVAVEEVISRMPGEKLSGTAVPNLVPHGQSFRYPRTATTARSSFIAGLFTLILAVMLWRYPVFLTSLVQRVAS